MYNSVLASIVTADDLVLKHQVISNYSTGSELIALDDINRKVNDGKKSYCY